ncbi:MAG: hypothetical protein DDT19_02326 [Syntrophomonadaceae bacterium]|nr:hypothetical protein [Bacillota bacterium]
MKNKICQLKGCKEIATRKTRQGTRLCDECWEANWNADWITAWDAGWYAAWAANPNITREDAWAAADAAAWADAWEARVDAE